MIDLVIILALMIPLLAVVLDSQLVRALAARLERNAKPEDPALETRLGALETEVERLTEEVRRLDEATRFVQKLLEGRAAPGALPSGEPPGDEA
jgi:hypothetical protein